MTELHINQYPPEEAPHGGMLHSIMSKMTDQEALTWLEARRVVEAWIYDIDPYNRVMAWFE